MFNSTFANVSFNATIQTRRGCLGSDYFRQLNPTYYTVRATVSIYILGTIIVLGLVGNLLTLLVLRKEKKSSTTLLLTCLAIGDSLFLLLTCMNTVYTAIEVVHFHIFGGIYPLLYPYLVPILRMVSMSVDWITLLVTFERYIAVHKPLKAKTICSKRKMAIALCIIVCFAIGFHVPMFFEFTLKETYDPANCEIFLYYYPTPLLHDKEYYIGYRVITEAIVRVFVPVISLIFFNYQLVKGLKEAFRRRQATVANNQGSVDTVSSNVTTMVVGVVTVFILCKSPYMVLVIVDIFIVVIPQRIRMNLEIREYSIMAINGLIIINSSVNFLLYVMLGKRFRQLFAAMCCSVCGKSDQMSAQPQRVSTQTSSVMTVNTSL